MSKSKAILIAAMIVGLCVVSFVRSALAAPLETNAPIAPKPGEKQTPSAASLQLPHQDVFDGRRYSLRATIRSPERYKNVPYAVELDFGKLLADQQARGTFDRFSVVVKRLDSGSGKLHDVHYNLSDDFLMVNKGKVNWLIEDTNQGEYVIFYDVKEHGPFGPPAYIGLVGNGDCLHYNDGRLHPMFVGMSANPIAVDWDGDGVTDLLSTQNYGFTRGSPEHAVQFLRNEGSNERPIFGDGIHLRYWDHGQYHYIPAGMCIEIVDWNGDGLPDLLANQYMGPTITIYLNTGRKDEHGLPILEKSGEIATRAGQYPCFRIVDLHGDGRKDLVVAYLTGEPKLGRNDPLWFKATEEEKQKAQWPRWYYEYRVDYHENIAGKRGQSPFVRSTRGAVPANGDCPLFPSPKFAPPVRLQTRAGKDITWHAVPSLEFMDWDGDGRDEFLTLCDSPLLDKGYSEIRVYKNVGTPAAPVFEDRGLVPGLRDRSGMFFRKANTAAFKGLLVATNSLGGKVRYYELTGRDSTRQIMLKDRGYLMQRNSYVNPLGGFVQAHVSDWENNGNWDLTMGCETGWVTRSRNIGTQKRPIYADTEFLEQDGKPIELLHGPFSDPGSIMEATIGQTAPAYLDWDGDGIMDLLVCMGRKFLFYKNAGTSLQPRLLKPTDVTTFDGKPVHDFRDKPVIMDWDGDGLVDIVGQTGGVTCFFKRYRDAQDGQLKLARGVPFKFADGAPLSLGGFYNAGDWDHRGVYDLFSTRWNTMLYCKNAGTNAQPAFWRPVTMTVDGQSLSVGNHVTTPLPVDWDHSGRLDILASGESGLLYLFRRAYLDGIHHKITCRTSEDWAIRRRQIIAGAEEVMGRLPGRSNLPPLDVKIIEQVDKDGYVRLSITYQSGDGDRVPAYLLLPKDRPPGRRLPAMVALHGTSRFGKKSVTGEAVVLTDAELKKADRTPNMFPTRNVVYLNMDYGKELAQRGYVVLAPDYPSFGDYPYDFRKSKYASGSMKAIANHIRGVDLLQSREEVDPERIGVIGHSLGGHNALFLGLFDQRVKVVVASAGWGPFSGSRHGNKPGGWDQDVYMPRLRTVYNFDWDRVPFDLPELVAAVAPRAFFSNSPSRDPWFSADAIKDVEPRIRAAYALLGAADRLQVQYPNCEHDFPPEIRRAAYSFLDRVIRHTPSRQVP
jgi:dienelactone hydrolase